MSWLLLSLFFGIPQDSSDAVKALVEKLGGDEIAARDQAEAGLIKLGREALPFIKKAAESAQGEVKSRLDRVVRRLVHDGALADFLATALQVTLDVKNQPAHDVLVELSRQSGIPIEAADLPADTRISVSAKSVHVMRAVDEICRAHGRLMYAASFSRVRIFPAPYKKRPLFEAGPYVFFVSDFIWTARKGPGSAGSQVWFQGNLVGPADRIPILAAIDVEAAVDDKGTDLGKPARPDGALDWFSEELEPSLRLGPRISMTLAWRSRTPPDADAAKFTEFRGRVRIHAALGFEKLLTIKNPGAALGRASRDGASFEIRSWSQKGRAIRVSYHLVREVPRLNPMKWDNTVFYRLAVHDAQGRRHLGVNLRLDTQPAAGVDSTTWSQDGVYTLDLPEGFEIETLDVLRVVDSEEITIPFDHSGIPLE